MFSFRKYYVQFSILFVLSCSIHTVGAKWSSACAKCQQVCVYVLYSTETPMYLLKQVVIQFHARAM